VSGLAPTHDGVILLTGAAGLVGGAVRSRIEQCGYRTIAIDRSTRSAAGRETLECDLTDPHALYALAQDQDIVCIVHCGGVSGPMLARNTPHAVFRANVAGTVNLLELARTRKIPRFVYCSSAAAYGATDSGPVDEGTALRPTNAYGASKAAAEQFVSAYAHQFGLMATSLRFSWIYGPNRRTDCVIRTMIMDALSRLPTRIGFGRDFPRQFVHIDDAVEAIVAAIERPSAGPTVYNIADGYRVTFAEVAEVVRNILPQADIELGSGPDPDDEFLHKLDIRAAGRGLGFFPSISLHEGIRTYAAWLRSQPETMQRVDTK
jgi:UDP-glucuronate 4-epimerase